MKKILEAIEKVEISELYDTEKDGPLIADFPITDVTIITSSNEEITIGRRMDNHLWLQRNHQGRYLTKLIFSLSSLTFITNY